MKLVYVLTQGKCYTDSHWIVGVFTLKGIGSKVLKKLGYKYITDQRVYLNKDTDYWFKLEKQTVNPTAL